MVGGIYAINRNFFFKLGGYDTYITGRGGENIEFSLRVILDLTGMDVWGRNIH